MKKILITGANSYIGTSFEKYIKEHLADRYTVDTVDMIDGSWRRKDFSPYDVVCHVAGIVHVKETKENAHLFYEINCDLAFETAQKAKAEGVRQFIFLSSMGVYGKQTGVITGETLPNPKNHYGISKFRAEELISKLADDRFKVVILRPPMVYGDGCKGNVNVVIYLVKRMPVFPKVNNKRSMLHVENLSSFIAMSIDRQLEGVFFPQDPVYMNTTALAVEVASRLHKKIYTSYLLGLAVNMLKPFSVRLKKAFGSLIYKDTECFDYSYCRK